ncbi:MAG: phenylphosphate carboxylase subunit delta, partial [Pirellulaceae bacterium]|nr:phenylphosphate carboxylase subunit delta [Pirellulaceae bacterium]
MKTEDRCKNVELILSDVDGVLTGGGIIFDNQGIETKRFHVRDGMCIELWQRAGFKFGILTARTS